jgi:predicted nucleotidyltransferase
LNHEFNSEIRPKDFLETEDGLIFAVVASGEEGGRALAFLRYIKEPSSPGSWQKVDTDQANAYLKEFYPDYLYHSVIFDADLHGVPFGKITKHHQPSEKLTKLMVARGAGKGLQKKLIRLMDLFINNDLPLSDFGVTGSFLIGAENKKSDIDLVIYDRKTFHTARGVVRALISEKKLSGLDSVFWKDAYERRSCSLSLEEYVWHEKRKYNKAVFDGIKFDLSLVVSPDKTSSRVYSKKGHITIIAKVTDDQYAFDTPGLYILDHPEYPDIVCFTPTYAGQALTGETVEVSGLVEESDDGEDRRIIVGSSREAPGEYIRVVS